MLEHTLAWVRRLAISRQNHFYFSGGADVSDWTPAGGHESRQMTRKPPPCISSTCGESSCGFNQEQPAYATDKYRRDGMIAGQDRISLRYLEARMRAVYLTSGPSRSLRFGAQTVELRHTPRWQLFFVGRSSGEVIRALAWLGRDRGAGHTSQLMRMLSAQTVQELSSARGQMPTWMAEQISVLVARV